MLDRRAGTINPMGYVRGLARAAQQPPARRSRYGDTRVEQLQREGDALGRLKTEQWQASRAKSVVLGTNAYTDALWPGLRRHIYQDPLLSTRDDNRWAKRVEHPSCPSGQGLWDTGPIMFSLRRDAFGRLIIGSMGTGDWRHATASPSAGPLVAYAAMFPNLGEVEFEHCLAWPA